MKLTYKHTIGASVMGNAILAILNGFAPLLFLTFQSTYNIPLAQITLLITLNFGIQLVVDGISIKFIDKLGYRATVVFAHLCGGVGMLLLAILPNVLPNPYAGLLTAVIVYAVGSGLLDVIISPIVESSPTEHKEKTLSFVHSFYSWGTVAVVLVSTLFFAAFGIHRWPILAVIWAAFPFLNMLLFTKVPIGNLLTEDMPEHSIKSMFTMPLFWLFLLMMFFAGASEMSVSQWASTYAEQALGVSKTVGDLAGPMLFAVTMGISRTFYGRRGDRIELNHFMLFSSILAVGSYLIISLSPWPTLGLIGCGICGFAIAIMWPGTLSLGVAAIPRGGTAMFALFALAGHLGASGGPTFVGMVSSAASDNMRIGLLAATIFPLLMTVLVLINQSRLRKDRQLPREPRR